MNPGRFRIPSSASHVQVIETLNRYFDTPQPKQTVVVGGSTAMPIGPAGGDLTGTYPNPSIANLQGHAVSAGAPTAGQFLQWGGSAWVPATISTAGWQTALDIDFTAQTTQTFASDGSYTIGAYTFSKVNSSNEATHAVLTNGTGIVFKPAASTDFHDNVRTIPALVINLSSYIPNFKAGTPVRAWLYTSANNVTASADQYVLAIENWSVGQESAYVQKQNYFSGNLGPFVMNIIGGANAGAVTFANTTLFNENVMMVECGIGVCGGTGLHMVGNYSSGWPPDSALDSIALSTSGTACRDIHAAYGEAGFWEVLIGAGRAGSGTNLSVTFARLKIEYKN